MKIRTDFVTNSSSSSYIICFARIVDEEKAKAIIEKHNLDSNVFDKDGVNREMYWGELGADWAGATIWGVDKILENHPDDKYIIIEDWLDADWDDETEEDIFYYDFDMNNAISDIQKKMVLQILMSQKAKEGMDD